MHLIVKHMADTRSVVLPEHDIDYAAQIGNCGKKLRQRLFDVFPARFRRSAEETESIVMIANQFGMVFRILCRNGIMRISEQFRFTEKDIDPDPETGAAFHGQTEFLKPFFRLFAAPGENT